MFEINDKARNLSKKEMLQYKKDGYITGLPVFSDNSRQDLDNFFVTLSSRLNTKIDLNQTAQWQKASKNFMIYV